MAPRKTPKASLTSKASLKAAPLEGIRVLDCSRVLAGPFCAQVLGDLGATVIKIERPGEGDETRAWGPPFHDGLSAYFLSCNRQKRSVALNLASKEGRGLLQQLVKQSDVLIENFRPASAARLKLSPKQLLTVNPRLVLCSISGFGRNGPLADTPGYDFAIQAMSGLMAVTGPVDGPPSKTGVAITDVTTGLYGAVAILAALRAKERSGHGYAIDLSLLDCAVAAQVNLAQAYLSSGKVAERQGNAHLQIVPYQLFAAADGWVVIAVGNDTQWRSFCEAADCRDLGQAARYATNPQRVAHRAELLPKLEQIVKRQSVAAWLERLSKAGVPHAPVMDYAELFAHPQALARNLKVRIKDAKGQPVDLLGSPLHIAGASLPRPRMPPRLGEDTAEVLQAYLGLKADAIGKLKASGVIACGEGELRKQGLEIKKKKAKSAGRGHP